VLSLTDDATVELALPTAVRLELDRIHASVVGDGLERLGLGA
jgi:Arc/MetJ family transcription regulator